MTPSTWQDAARGRIRGRHDGAGRADRAAAAGDARIARQLRQDNPEGLTLTQLSTLVRVEEHEPVRPGQLATLEGISPSTLTRLIASLEETGLLLRMTDPHDGRVSHLRLSDEGRETLARIRSRRNAALQQRIAGSPTPTGRPSPTRCPLSRASAAIDPRA